MIPLDPPRPTPAARAGRGADLLDLQAPGWAGRIDLDSLDIGSRTECVLGQLYGSYFGGLEALELCVLGSTERGFRAASMHDTAALDTAWHDLIVGRREA